MINSANVSLGPGEWRDSYLCHINDKRKEIGAMPRHGPERYGSSVTDNIPEGGKSHMLSIFGKFESLASRRSHTWEICNAYGCTNRMQSRRRERSRRGSRQRSTLRRSFPPSGEHASLPGSRTQPICIRSHVESVRPSLFSRVYFICGHNLSIFFLCWGRKWGDHLCLSRLVSRRGRSDKAEVGCSMFAERKGSEM